MKTQLHPIALTVTLGLAVASLLPASDLASYRDFRLGSSASEVARQVGMNPSTLVVISSRPERIEELNWRLDQSAQRATSPDSVKEIRFRFFNGNLFEMTVTYDTERTAGLTEADVKDALSAIYGPPSAPDVKEMSFNSGYNSTVRVVAQWGDAQNLVSLVGLSYGEGFGVVASSRPTLLLAQRAMVESERLDRVEAPQRALDVKARQAADDDVKNAKARLLNKPGFRP